MAGLLTGEDPLSSNKPTPLNYTATPVFLYGENNPGKGDHHDRQYRRAVPAVNFKILGNIKQEETFATGGGIREVARLRKMYGNGRWRKRKGKAGVQFDNGSVRYVELH